MAGKLTARGVAALTKPGRHADGGGLYLNITASAARSWVFLYQRAGRRRELGLGPLRDVSLAEARAKAADMRGAVSRGEDPAARREAETVRTFGAAADALLADVSAGWKSAKHRAQWKMTLTTYAAELRPKPVAEVGTDDVLAVLKPLWQRVPETASRTRGRVERVLDYAKARGWRTGENPARWRGHLSLMLTRPKKLTRGHHKALPVAAVPGFIKDLRRRSGLGARALELTILTAARTSEMTGMRWDEVDLAAAVWTVPAERMKLAREHRVPLPPRAVAILEDRRTEALALADGGETALPSFVWPGTKPGKPISTATMEAVLERMKVDATVHGFRSSFRDWTGDRTTFPRELAELALAHAVGDETEQAYRRSDALEKRRALMKAWADFCAGERGKVVPIGRRRA